MNLRNAIFTLLAGAALTGSEFAQTVYITNGDASQMQAIDVTTGAITYTATTHSIGYPIAVRNTIWIGQRDNTGPSREYDLNGNFTGNSVNLSGGNTGNFVDGAVNGTTNYTITAFSTLGEVYSTQSDWQNPTLMFSTTTSTQWVGITYDPVLNRLWLADQTTFRRYTLAGVEEASFAHTADRSSIAYDPATNSLWLVPNNANAPLEHYATDGSFLGSVTTPTRSDNVWGAEFSAAAVPEPTTIALCSVAFAGAIATSRWGKKRRIARKRRSVPASAK